MLNLTLVGDTKLIAKLDRLPNEIRQQLVRKVTALSFRLQSLVKAKLTNRVLHVRTGALRDSIFREVHSNSESVVGKVASGGNVKYAAIHEFGGVIPAHDIAPNKAKVLAFQKGGKMIFAKHVRIPTVKMPERSYLRSSMREMKEEIRQGLIDAVRTGVRSR